MTRAHASASRAFTLIELLVVIAIIGILSSIVLASLNAARQLARVSAIESGVLQFRNLMELEYLDTGSYTNLNRGWVGTGVDCSARGYGGNFAQRAIEICTTIRNNIINKTTLDIHTGVKTSAGLSNSTQYSIIVRMPNGRYLCAGSSGNMSEENVNDGTWLGPGCFGNP
jgi:prepilin-type N-terminal cleavage/methylation domain-containing protein